MRLTLRNSVNADVGPRTLLRLLIVAAHLSTCMVRGRTRRGRRDRARFISGQICANKRFCSIYSNSSHDSLFPWSLARRSAQFFPALPPHSLLSASTTMGSVVSLPTAISITLIAGGILYGFLEKRPPPPAWNARSIDSAPTAEKKKGKKKKGGQADATAAQPAPTEPAPTVVSFPAVVPGGFESVTDAPATPELPTKSKAKKKKAKKAGSTGTGGGTRAIPLDAQSESSATAPESSTPVARPTKHKSKSPPVADADGPWTRVETRRRNGKESQPTPSDAGVTTSVTGTSSPTGDEASQSLDTDANRRTLAEKLLPKARKTGVEE